MENLDLKLILTAIGSTISYFLGGYDMLLQALILFVVIDYITGVLAAIKGKSLSAEVGYWGIIKKVLLFVVVGIAHTIDLLLAETGNLEIPVLRTIACWGFLINELFSLAENMTACGVKFPQIIIDTLEKFKPGKGA